MAIQCLHGAALEGHLEAPTAPECSGVGSEEHASVCPCATPVPQTAPVCLWKSFKLLLRSIKPYMA